MHANKIHYLLLAALALGFANAQAMGPDEDEIAQSAGYATGGTSRTAPATAPVGGVLDWQGVDFNAIPHEGGGENLVLEARQQHVSQVRSVNLSGAQNFEIVLYMLAFQPSNGDPGFNLEELNLFRTQGAYTAASIDSLAKILATQNVRRLDLSSSGLTDQGALALISQLGVHGFSGRQVTVNLDGNNLSPPILGALRGALDLSGANASRDTVPGATAEGGD